MTQLRWLALTAAALFFALPASQAKADLVTYEFTAVVTSGDYAGETINGTITVDDETEDSSGWSSTGVYKGAVTDYSMEMESGNQIDGAAGDVRVTDTFFYDNTTVVDNGGTTTINGGDPKPGKFVLRISDIGWNPDLNDSDDLSELDTLALADADYDKLTFERDGAQFVADVTSFAVGSSEPSGGSTVAEVPELDAGEAPAAFAVVAGAALVLEGRRRRA